MGIGEKSPTADKVEEGLLFPSKYKYTDRGAATPPEGSSSSCLRTIATPSIPLSSQDESCNCRVQRLPQSQHADIQGCYQNLRSRKIRLVYFLLMTAVALGLLIAVIALAVTRPQSANASSTTQEKILCAQCEDGWIIYKGKCYYISDDVKPWTDSQKYCTEHNSSLAIIDNKEEYDFLKKNKGDNNCWIGLSKRGKDSGWVWADGKPYSENIFTIKEETPGDIQHVYLNKDSAKSDGQITPKKFVCQKKLIIQPA